MGQDRVMGELVGYARVSSVGQKLDVQLEALRKTGVSEDLIYREKVSGTKRDGRMALEELLGRGIRKGDTLVVTKLDRLARSSKDLQDIAATLEEKQVGLKVLDQNIDTTTPEGRMFFSILGAIAQFETEIRKTRQREGIDAALAKGADSPFKGRPVTIDADEVQRLRDEGLSPSQVAKRMGIARSSVYRFTSRA